MNRALRSLRLVGIGDSRVQVSLGRTHLVLERLHERLLCRQIALCLHAILVGRNSLFRQFDHAAAVALGPFQRRFRLQQLGARRLQPRLRVDYAARSRSPRRLQSRLSFGNLGFHAVDGGRGRALFRLQFRRIKQRDQITLLHLRSFVNQQLRQSSLDLRAHDHLVANRPCR